VIDVNQDSGGFPKYLRDTKDASVSIETTKQKAFSHQMFSVVVGITAPS
jgi:hypothetical protein